MNNYTYFDSPGKPWLGPSQFTNCIYFLLEGWDLWFLNSAKAMREELFLEMVEKKRFPEVCEKLTAKTLMDYSDNPLIFAIEVSEVMPSTYPFI